MPLDLNSLDVPRWLASYSQRQYFTNADNCNDAIEEGTKLQAQQGQAQALMQALQDADTQRKASMVQHQNERRKKRQEARQQQSKIDRQLWQERIAIFKTKEQQAQQAFQQILETLPNYVDHEIINEYPTLTTNTPSSTLKVPSSLVMDHNPAYEMAVYERIHDKTVVWSRRGTMLCHALAQHIIHNINLHDKNVSEWEMPHNMAWEHDTRALSFASTNTTTDEDSTMAQSWEVLAASSAVANQSLLDRQLPRLHILRGHRNNNPNQQDTWSDRHVFMSHVQQRPWFQLLATDQYINVLVVAGPNLTDSRPLQIRLVRQYQDTLQKLLPTTQRGETKWTTVAAAAQNLLPYESSRLLLQAASNNRNDKGKRQSAKQIYYTLVSVSNLESYVSLQLRHSTTNEPLHILLVKFAPMAIILDWMVSETAWENKQTVFRVPPCLSPWVPTEEGGQISVQRKVVLGKNGKRSIQTVKSQSKTRVEKLVSGATSIRKQTQRFLPWDVTSGTVTEEQIRGEALTCPFGFLPLHKKNEEGGRVSVDSNG